jgi:hypothetical protein
MREFGKIHTQQALLLGVWGGQEREFISNRYNAVKSTS